MTYTFSQLETLWTQAGGSSQTAAMAAAVALAESGGNPNATDLNGGASTDRGLWQINSVHGSQSTFDPMGNARAAIAISNNGQNWRPWCTAYTDGACGTKGGSYLGAGSPAMKILANGGGSYSGGSDSSGSGTTATTTGLLTGTTDQITSYVTGVFQVIVYGLMMFAGVGLMGLGLVLMFKESPLGGYRGGSGIVGKVATTVAPAARVVQAVGKGTPVKKAPVPKGKVPVKRVVKPTPVPKAL